MFVDEHPEPATDLHLISTVLTTDERTALEVFISAGAKQLGFRAYGPGADHPIFQACNRLGLDVSAFHG